ncbi:MAG: thiamine ABC transporter substrate-binding protein [Chloroflexi bacterium]|uniref:thiamine ABC transporter substrate-binding protein n=1 Tax=Candidatus Flexifilum breve TaxID=3140694 RepID=UPI003135F089|nr:thiamine ABC transporter substrate-binding protein [Chloroflexota bacterium]
MTKVIWITTLLLLLGAAAVSAQDNTLTVVAHDSFAYTEEILAQFQQETGITVEVLRLGDAGTMLNQLILSKSNPLGDVVFGVDNTFLSRALNEDLFIAYESPALQSVDEAFIVDPDHNVTPVDYGDVCLNYDIAYFEENGLALPESLADLTKPEYSGLLVVENPATSSPGLAFLMATVAAFGAEGDYTYLDYWTDLVANDVAITEGWTDAYYGEFTRYGGSRPLVVSYASSPPAEVLFADPPTDVAPTGSIVADGTCFRQIEFAGILQGTDNLEAAQQFMDFLLSVDFQEDMPTQMFVFPVNGNAELPEVFIDYAQIPENPVVLDPADIDAGREEWIEAWTETVLR